MLAAPGSRKLQIGNLTFLEYGTVKRLEKEKKTKRARIGRAHGWRSKTQSHFYHALAVVSCLELTKQIISGQYSAVLDYLCSKVSSNVK